MADTTKLAGTFKAWRATIGVQPKYLVRTVSRCEDLGLQPRLISYDNGYKVITLSVTIPCSVCAIPCRNFTETHLKEFHALLLHAVQVNMICEPEKE
jgi:hypothetical protein